MKPVHCGRNATPYFRQYGRNGWESGFRCKVCGRDRLPYESPGKWTTDEEYEAIRLAGVAFDASLNP